MILINSMSEVRPVIESNDKKRNYLVALQTAEIDLERYSAAKSEYLEAILAGLEDVDSTSAQVQAQPS
jgi:hypothetical protein